MDGFGGGGRESDVFTDFFACRRNCPPGYHSTYNLPYKQALSLLWSTMMAAPIRISIVMTTKVIEQGKGQHQQQHRHGPFNMNERSIHSVATPTPSTSTGNRMKEDCGIISTQPHTGPQQIESIQSDHNSSNLID